MEPIELARIQRMLGTGGDTAPSMAMLSTGGGITIEQTQMAPEGLEWLEDVSHAHWIEESLRTSGPFGPCFPVGFSITLASFILPILVMGSNRCVGVR